MIFCVWNFFNSEIVKTIDKTARGWQSFFMLRTGKKRKNFPGPAFENKNVWQ